MKSRKPRIIRCPKCRKRTTSFQERWDMTRSHDIEGGEWLSAPDGDGFPYAVDARCDCGHSWRLRNVLQITDIEPFSSNIVGKLS